MGKLLWRPCIMIRPQGLHIDGITQEVKTRTSVGMALMVRSPSVDTALRESLAHILPQ